MCLDCDKDLNFSISTGPQGPVGPTGATGLTGPQGIQGNNGAQGIPGSNGTNGTNGIDGADGADGAIGSELLYVYNTKQNPDGLTFGASTTVLNNWTSLQNFIIPYDIPPNDYLEIDMKILSNSPLDVKGLPTDLFRIISGDDIICDQYPIVNDLELMAMFKWDEHRRSYNLNLKIFSALPALKTFSTMCNWTCNGQSVGFNTAGGIEINTQQMERLELLNATTLNFQIKQVIPRSVIIQTLYIKHVKQ